MHHLLRQHLIKAGLEPSEICDPALIRFIQEVDQHYKSAAPNGTAHGTFSANGHAGACHTGPADVQSEAFSAILDSIPGYVSWVTNDLRYLGVNQALAERFGRKPSDFTGQKLDFLGHGSELGEFLTGFFASSEENASFTCEIKRTEEEDSRWHSFFAGKFNEGKCAIILGFNIHELKKAQEALAMQEGQLMRSAKMAELGQVAAAIAHEINNPLGAILGMSQILKRNLTSGDHNTDRCKELSEKIEIMAVRIGKLMRSCLSFSRDGKNDPFQPVPLKSILEDTLELVRGRFQEHGVTLEVEPFDADLTIDCRAGQISQVLVNLLNNALDAVEILKRRWVRISITAEDGMALIKVTDAGEGIPAPIAAKIFSAFFTTKQASRGTGLGLSIASGIVKEHRGSLELLSDQEHTTFLVKLPLV